jgi:5-oxoprolinase (ATP-hydrolysing)
MDWEFWIDVGGTFTDCFGRDRDGNIVRAKLLSSGATKGRIGRSSSESWIEDEARRNDGDGFWNGYGIRFLDEAGKSIAERRIKSFGATGLELELPLPVAMPEGTGYELFSHEEAPIVAIRRLLGLRLDQPIPPVQLRLGTTRGTNALLTRRGARTAFITTRGFADVLLIGYQQRPKLFALDIEKPTPLFESAVEIDERVLADGTVRRAPDAVRVREQLVVLRERGVESLAICLLHADRFPEHERLVATIAAEVGFAEVSVSHEVAPLVKIVARGDTTVVDAYLNPILRAYVDSLARSLPGSRIRLMTSAGGLVSPASFRGKDSILSGPAGGVVGFARAAEIAGFTKAIGFDMGGTSTDVARYDGRFEREYETEKAGVRVVAPMMAIHTVAAGGGSICDFDGTRLLVGPGSAGADPGPACYGRGGPLTVTDANLFLGRIPEDRFPFRLDRPAVERQLDLLRKRMAAALGREVTREEIASGCVTVANHHMARAIRTISVARGYDPRDYPLVAFGAAAGQHACAVARELGIRQVLSHPDAGLLSAYGIGQSLPERNATLGVYRILSDDAMCGLEEERARLEAELGETLHREEGTATENILFARSYELRYRGYDATLQISVDDGVDVTSERRRTILADGFRELHRRTYGYVHEGRELELVAFHLTARARNTRAIEASTCVQQKLVESLETCTAHFSGWQQTPLFDREALQPGAAIVGPAIIAERYATTVIDPGWKAEMLTGGELLLTDEQGRAQATSASDSDPIMVEIFNQQFAGIAEQMGVTLRNTATSVNVKERLDFSCAVFTASGDLVVNAPHIPVHLGAMSETVRRVIQDNPGMRPGDVFVTNDPFRGGSHLPDVTVVTPVHDRATGELLFFTGSRAHHAEIGGVTPGSMPPFSKNLAEEGVLIRNRKLIDAGHSCFDELERLLRDAPYPSRNVAENLADLRAQVAANQYGVTALLELVERYSLPVVRHYMQRIQAAAETKMRGALARLPRGRRTFTDHLDDGSPITVAVSIDDDGIEFDFTGTGSVLAGNLNANRAIVTAAVMYCLRVLIDEDIPLNAGVLAPVKITLPECLLSPPERERPEECAAIVGGNVETSQRVVDVLLGALGLAAASQGTMNNLLFGDGTFGYYETICGGAGATSRAAGADAVHTHMTNTRLTDPEILERRYPVVLCEFGIRADSGGDGRHRGGDGVTRTIEFLQPLTLSLLTQRRGPYPPYGVDGGGPGALGKNTLVRADGTTVPLDGLSQIAIEPGDVLTLQTPGGGGWGAPTSP